MISRVILFSLLAGAALADPPPSDADETVDPDEAALFGEADDETPPTRGSSSSDSLSEEDVFNGDSEPAAPLFAKEDPLAIGGLLYIRPTWTFTDSSNIEDHPTSMPNLLEVYLDARPSDRLRAFVRGRLTYDPTASDESTTFGLSTGGRDTVSVSLDQLWLNFDVERVFFVTIGATHVRWGASRIWNPVDVVNTARRDPLQPFDDRTGIPMVKLHFPMESLGWNLYLVGMLDQVDSIDKAGVAVRAEVVALTAELGLTGAIRDGVDGKFGFDWSIGVSGIDLTGELGITFTDEGPRAQLTGGVQYTGSYGDDDIFVVGAEYFFNQLGHKSVEDSLFAAGGVDDVDGFEQALGQSVLADPVPDFTTAEGQALAASRASAYTADLFGGLEFFYVGRHYAAMFASLPGPGTWDTGNITMSTIGNLSDKSFVARLDLSWSILTYLRVQTFVQVHFGQPGELNFGPKVFEQINDKLSPLGQEFDFPAQVAQVGLWLRLDI
ncbi:MAG: hypothetical protein ACI9OJ_000510 [Myxococcota bacterium]